MKKTRRAVWIFSFVALFLLAAPRLWAEDPSGDEAPEEYTVEKGDTLWDISQRFFRNPFKWPAIWGINEHIQNPDLIYPGNKVKLLRSPPPAPQEEVKEEAPKEMPPLETVAVTEPPSKNYNLRAMETDEDIFFASGFIDDAGGEAGVLSHSFHEKTHFDKGDKAGVTFKGHSPKIGDRFVVFSSLNEVRHPKTQEKIGDLIQIQGHLQIVEDNQGVYTAVITKVFDVMTVGSKIRAYEEIPIPLLDPEAPPPLKNIEGYIVAAKDKKRTAGQGSVVYIDRGRIHGVAPGDLYAVYENIPALKSSGLGYEKDKDAPGALEQKIGAFRILTVRSKTATALIVDSLHEIDMGRKFRSPKTKEEK